MPTMTIAMLQIKNLRDVVWDKIIIKVNPKTKIISRKAKHKQNINRKSKLMPSSIDVTILNLPAILLRGDPSSY